jgi:hypothetical protein
MNVFNFYKSINGKTSLSVLWVLKKNQNIETYIKN